MNVLARNPIKCWSYCAPPPVAVTRHRTNSFNPLENFSGFTTFRPTVSQVVFVLLSAAFVVLPEGVSPLEAFTHALHSSRGLPRGDEPPLYNGITRVMDVLIC